jgi:hypothetical protein
MPDDPMADYFAAKREADGIVAGLRAAVASISAGTRALENLCGRPRKWQALFAKLERVF